LEHMLKDPENGFCREGYADEYYHERQGVTEYLRRDTGPVSKETLAYRAQRQVVQNMMEAMR
jgi:hypothetical protein